MAPGTAVAELQAACSGGGCIDLEEPAVAGCADSDCLEWLLDMVIRQEGTGGVGTACGSPLPATSPLLHAGGRDMAAAAETLATAGKGALMGGELMGTSTLLPTSPLLGSDRSDAAELDSFRGREGDAGSVAPQTQLQKPCADEVHDDTSSRCHDQ